MNRADRRAMKRAQARHVATFPQDLERVPRAEWPDVPPGWEVPIEVWRSRRYVVTVYPVAPELGALERISVTRTDRGEDTTWDELQEVKRQIGRGDVPAVELYPPDAVLKDVAPMRHLWTLPELPGWAWRDPARRYRG